MKGFVEAVKGMPDFYGFEGVSEESIAAAGDVLGVTFARDFKEYLECIGVCSVNGHEIVGLGASERLDVVLTTKEARSEAPYVPSDWYAIERVGIDGVVAWQNAAGEIFISTPSSCGREKIADSLLEYLKS